MTTHIITIEKSKNLYCAYSENFVGAYGCGKTIEEVKSQALKGYELFLKENQLPKEKLNIIWKIKATAVKDIRLIKEK
jgi:predicted RNase H-like HicB family nuclease